MRLLLTSNFFAHSSDVISRGSRQWRREILASFSGATATDTGDTTKVKVNCAVSQVDSIEIQLLTWFVNLQSWLIQSISWVACGIQVPCIQVLAQRKVRLSRKIKQWYGVHQKQPAASIAAAQQNRMTTTKQPLTERSRFNNYEKISGYFASNVKIIWVWNSFTQYIC